MLRQVRSYVSANFEYCMASDILALLRTGRLVPNILPDFTPTIGPLTITYPQGIVNYGNTLNLSVVAYAPLIQFSGEADYPDATYTVLMVRDWPTA